MAQKRRIDVLLVERGLFPTRDEAKRAIIAGKVIVGQERVDKPGIMVDPQASLFVKPERAHVSRGGEKLERALKVFGLDPAGLTALDAGAGTGGFTEVLLKYGARKVYAVDVGYGVLDWRLRQNPRVVVLERTNVRYLEAERLDEPADIVTGDLSFISLKKVVGNLKRLSKEHACFVLLIKPQFEARREQVAKGGLVKDAAVHREVLADLCAFFEEAGLTVAGLTYSPITGAGGNIEFFVYAKKREAGSGKPEAGSLREGIDKVVQEAHTELGGLERLLRSARNDKEGSES